MRRSSLKPMHGPEIGKSSDVSVNSIDPEEVI